MGEPIEDGERDPDTIAEEQRRRAEEMDKEGVEPWKARHDNRPDDEKPKQVKGVSPTAIDEDDRKDGRSSR
jgi:hypothetical protein